MADQHLAGAGDCTLSQYLDATRRQKLRPPARFHRGMRYTVKTVGTPNL